MNLIIFPTFMTTIGADDKKVVWSQHEFQTLYPPDDDADNGWNISNEFNLFHTSFYMNVEDSKKPECRKRAIYMVIWCAECPATYIGETGWNLNAWINEPKGCTALGGKTNNTTIHLKKSERGILRDCDFV